MIGVNVPGIGPCQALTLPGVTHIFVKEFPDKNFSCVAMFRLVVPWAEATHNFRIELDILDETGGTLRKDNQLLPGQIMNGTGNVVDLPFEDQYLSGHMALDHIEIPVAGWYDITLLLDGKRAKTTVMRFNLLAGTKTEEVMKDRGMQLP